MSWRLALLSRCVVSASTSSTPVPAVKPRFTRLAALFAIAAALCLGSAGARAQTALTVNTLADSNDATNNCGSSGTGTTCSLRDAIGQANSDNDGDTIAFSVTGTITLGSALPTIAANLTIAGPGANQLTISGASTYRILSIGTVGATTVSISGLTFANGSSSSAGGAIYDYLGTLTVSQCVFAGNSGGTVDNEYAGGAISFLSSGTLTVTNTSFSGNSATGGGGAIFNGGTLIVADSAFSGNSVPRNFGGAVLSDGGTETVTNSTFSGNAAPGEYGGAIAVYGSGTVSATNDTFSGNSSGVGGAVVVLSGSTLSANNNLFVGNTAAYAGAGIYNIESTVNGGYNVYYNNLTNGSEDDCDGCTSGAPGSNGNILAGSNPLTLPLGNYGGATESFLPQPGSQAICAGSYSLASAANLTTDQREFEMNSSCIDAGSVQSNYVTVTTLGDGLESCPGAACTLRTAISQANSATYGAIGSDMDFEASLTSTTSPGTITLGSGYGSLTFSGTTNINIIGPGANQLTISGGGSGSNFSVFTINGGAQALLYGVTVSSGNTTEYGGGILNEGTLTLISSAVAGNAASFYGGGIYNNGTLTVVDSTISGNSSANLAGGIFNGGTLQVTQSTVADNSVSNSSSLVEAGGIYSGGTLNVTDSTIAGNSASGAFNGGWGGGIYLNGPATLANSVVAGNSSNSTSGGGNANIYSLSGYSNDSSVIGGNANATSSYPNGDTSAPQITLSPLQYNGIGATLETMIPLPGSAAICAGTVTQIPAGTTMDERGYPLEPTGGYCPSGAVDSGAVQTNYASLAFVQQPSNVDVNAVMSPAPSVQLLESDTLLSSTDCSGGVVLEGNNGCFDGVNGATVDLALGVGTATLTGNSTTTSGSGSTAGEAAYGSLEIAAPETNEELVANLPVTPTGISPAFTLTATSNAFNVIGSVAQLAVSAPASVTAGAQLNVTVTAEDSAGNTVTNYSDAVQLTTSDPSATLPGPFTLTNGTQTSAVILYTAGNYTVSATDTSNSSISGSTATSVSASTPAMVVAWPPSGPAESAYMHTAFATPLTVNVTDQYGNSVSGATVIFTAPASGASASLSNAGSCTTASGICSVNAAANGTTGSYVVTATVSGYPGAGGVNFSLTNTAPPSLVVTSAADDTGTASNCTVQSSTTSGTDVSCSLRDALLQAASLGTANIYFDSTKFAGASTITLTNGALTIPAYTAITGLQGSGAGQYLVSVSGNGASQVFSVSSGTAGAAVANLIVTNGHNNGSNGGGIYDGGQLMLSNCTLSNNTEPYSGGVNFGGAVFGDVGSTLSISNCTLSGNSGSVGGAIFTYGTLTASGSTFVNNSTDGAGGAIALNGAAATGTITDSTFSANSAGDGGAIISNGSGGLTVTNSTFASNAAHGGFGASGWGGGIVSPGSTGLLTANNNIFEGNTALAGGAGIYNESGGTANANYNVYYDNLTSGSEDDCNNCTTNSNAISASTNPLATLGNYGGPTQTLIPPPGSAAICAGSASLASNADLTVDQRSLPIAGGGYCPSGSVDAGAVATSYSLAFSTQPSPIAPATAIDADTSFQAAVTLSESGTAFTGAGVSIPLALNGSGTLTGGTASTTNGVAGYSALQVSDSGTGDALTASLELNPAGTTISVQSQTFTVHHTSQSISFATIPSQTVNTTLTLSATASSSLPVTFSSETTGVCTVSGNTASLIATGTCTIDASQAGNSAYSPAANVGHSFSVKQ
jgi:CSLREA domain-containing protein